MIPDREESMAKVEREHEILSEPLTAEYVESRRAEGWRPVAVLWERRVDREIPEPRREAVPYGLEVAPDCRRLQENAEELEIMRSMLKLIVDEVPFSEIAERLNGRGYRTRAGDTWTQTAVFHLLPRLIEAAPEIYGSREWLEMKPGRAAAL